MTNRPVRLLAAMLALAVLALPGAPTRADSAVAWTDEPGDATGLDPFPPPAPTVAGSTPRPGDPGLDLLDLSAASDGQSLTFTAKTAVDEIPPGASGTTFRFVFTYDGIAYQLIAQRTAADFSTLISTGIFFRAREPRSPELNCRECSVRYDAKAATVTATATVASLASGIRQHAPDSTPLAPGTELSELMILGQRNVLPLERSTDVGRTLTVDIAEAGEATLTI